MLTLGIHTILTDDSSSNDKNAEKTVDIGELASDANLTSPEEIG